MEKKTTKLNLTTGEPRKKMGGARAGAGRKKDGRNQLSVGGLLEMLEVKAGGKPYEELLVTDFLQARHNNDSQLVIKYHNLILNTVMTNMAKIEVTDSSEAIEAKKVAFADALAKLTCLQKE
jgi:hypothetical protein